MILLWTNIFSGLFVSSIGGHFVTERVILFFRKKYNFPKEYNNLADWVGILERIAYTFSIILGLASFIGVWFALKAVGRWSTNGVLEQNVSRANAPLAVNIFCIGNLISLFFGVIGAIIILSPNPVINLKYPILILNNLRFSDDFWNAASAITNTLMAMATFSLLRETVRSRKELNKRLVVGEVISPILNDLDSVEIFLNGDSVNYRSPQLINRWRWKDIKLTKYSVIYLLEKRILEEIEDYDRELTRFNYLFIQRVKALAEIIAEDFKINVLPNINYILAAQYGKEDFVNGFPYNSELRIVLGGRRLNINLFHAILSNMTFKEYVKSSEQVAAVYNTEISYRECMIEGLKREEIDENVLDNISRRVKEKIENDSNLQEFIAKYKDILRRTKNLQNILMNI